MTQQDKIYLHAWRTATDDSQARYDRRMNAILASSSRSVPMNVGCRKIVLNHLDWSSESLSPLISVTEDREWAFQQARRRKKQGEANVVVHEICISKRRLRKYERRGKRISYRQVYKWLDLARARLPRYANYACTDQEHLFLHEIPGIFIVKTFKVWRKVRQKPDS